jgi:hypothetical protein
MRWVLMLMAALTLTSSASMAASVRSAPPIAQAQIDDTVRQLLPPSGGGSPIPDSKLNLAYVAGGIGFIIVFGLAILLVRLAAVLLMIACFVGGIVVVCAELHAGVVKTWEQLAALVVMSAVPAAIVFISANVYAWGTRSPAANSHS